MAGARNYGLSMYTSVRILSRTHVRYATMKDYKYFYRNHFFKTKSKKKSKRRPLHNSKYLEIVSMIIKDIIII